MVVLPFGFVLILIDVCQILVVVIVVVVGLRLVDERRHSHPDLFQVDL